MYDVIGRWARGMNHESTKIELYGRGMVALGLSSLNGLATTILRLGKNPGSDLFQIATIVVLHKVPLKAPGQKGITLPRWDIGNKVRWGKQKELHTKGTNSGKSFMDSLDDAQGVLDAFHSGKGTVLKTNANQNRVYFMFKEITGNYVNAKHGISEASNVFMIKGSGTATVVPVNPMRW